MFRHTKSVTFGGDILVLPERHVSGPVREEVYERFDDVGDGRLGRAGRCGGGERRRRAGVGGRARRARADFALARLALRLACHYHRQRWVVVAFRCTTNAITNMGVLV